MKVVNQDGLVKEVTQKAYEVVFRRQGYVPLEETNVKKEPKHIDDAPKKDVEITQNRYEKMTVDELKSLLDARGIEDYKQGEKKAYYVDLALITE